MEKMNLPTFLYKTLSTICEVYENEVPATTSVPYLVYELEYDDKTSHELVTADIKVWSKKTPGKDISTDLDSIAETIDQMINGLNYSDDEITIWIHRPDGPYKRDLSDPEPDWRGKLLMYEIKLYKKGVDE